MCLATLQKSVAPMDEELPPPPPELRNEINTKAHILGADDDTDNLPPPVSLNRSLTFFLHLSYLLFLFKIRGHIVFVLFVCLSVENFNLGCNF